MGNSILLDVVFLMYLFGQRQLIITTRVHKAVRNKLSIFEHSVLLQFVYKWSKYFIARLQNLLFFKPGPHTVQKHDMGVAYLNKMQMRAVFIPACSQIWARVIQGWSGPCFGALLWREEATSDSACSTRDAAIEVAWTEPAVEIQTFSKETYIGAFLHIWPLASPYMLKIHYTPAFRCHASQSENIDMKAK